MYLYIFEGVSIMTELLWVMAMIILITWLRKAYVPYETGKVKIIEYGDEFYSALLSVPGKDVKKLTGEIYDNPRKKGIFWGLFSGRIILYPLFRVKENLESIQIYEKDVEKLTETEKEYILFKTSTKAFVFLKKHSDSFLYQNTYYYGFNDLETGNDLLSNDDRVKKPELEHVDVEVLIIDKMVLTNVKDLFYQEESWYKAKKETLRPLIRNIAINNSYRALQKKKSNQEPLIVKERNWQDLVNEELRSLHLGNSSIRLDIGDIKLGKNSKAYEQILQERNNSYIKIDIAENINKQWEAEVKAKKEAVSEFVELIIKLRKTPDATSTQKWEQVKNSKLSHLMETGNSKENEQNLQYLWQLLQMFVPSNVNI